VTARRDAPAIPEWGAWTLIVALVAARTVLSLHDLRLPGLQYDETDFVNAATLRVPGDFLSHSFAGIPLTIFPDTGALKSWIYAPIFSVFGESMGAIRTPVVLVTAAALLLLYPAVRDLVNRPVAVMTTAICCLDGGLFWLTRDDVGPNALQFLFQCAALFALARYGRSERPRWLAVLVVVLLLGTFNKVVFIWVVNATTLGLIARAVVHRRRLRTRRPQVANLAAGLTLVYLVFAWFYTSSGTGVLDAGRPGLIQPWGHFWRGIERALTGTSFYAYALGPIGERPVVVWVTLALFAIGAASAIVSRPDRSLPVAILATGTVLIAVQILFTKGADDPWHYLSIVPYVDIVAAYGVWALVTRLPVAVLPRAAVLTAATCAGLLYSGVLLSHSFRALHREPRLAVWSPAIYRLSRYVQDHRGTVVSADWGINNPLFALHPSRRYLDAAGPTLVIAHTPRAQYFSHADAHLHAALGSHLRRVRVIDGPGGVPVFDVYRLR
jgi:4-amino-4-deoxy-L-arabinose transferase-like glycosyltransferase